MPQRPRASFLHGSCPLGAALALACIASGAWADDNPYYIGASQAFTHNSNVFQQVNGQGDTISSTGLLAGIDKPFGRQRFHANGSVQANRFNKLDQLNNTSYGLTAGLDWETVERLSGTLRYSTNRSLANYADANLFSPVPLTIRDLQTIEQLGATARYGITAQVGLEGGVSHQSVDYSVPQDKRGFKQDSANVGVRWGKSGLLTLGAGVRVTKGKYPQAVISPAVAEVLPSPGVPGSPAVPAQFGPDTLDRNDIDFTATWVPSGLSTVNGRISLSREKHSQPSIPTFNGVTGAVSWDYKLTGKTTVRGALIRDTGSQTTFANLPLGLLPVSPNNDRINTTLQLDANYAATAKIALNATLRHSTGTVQNVNSPGASSSTDQYALGATYSPTRSIGLGCNISQERRSSIYTVNIAGCSAQITLR